MQKWESNSEDSRWIMIGSINECIFKRLLLMFFIIEEETWWSKSKGDGESELVHQRRLWLVSEHYRALKPKVIAFLWLSNHFKSAQRVMLAEFMILKGTGRLNVLMKTGRAMDYRTFWKRIFFESYFCCLHLSYVTLPKQLTWAYKIYDPLSKCNPPSICFIIPIQTTEAKGVSTPLQSYPGLSSNRFINPLAVLHTV